MATKRTEVASIISCLRQLWPDFQLTNDNQMNPTSDIAIKFYERFICGQLQIEIRDIQNTLIEYASYSEAYADILNIYALYMCTATVINKLGLIELIQTFGLTDLINPTRKKFKMSLILLSNCVIYFTGLQELMEEVKNDVFQALQSTKDISLKIDCIKEKINNSVISHTKNIQTIEDLKKNKCTLLKQIQSTQEHFEQVEEETKLKRIELNQIQDTYEVLETKLNNLYAIEEKLKSQIVDDHQSIKCEKDRLIKEKNELSEATVDYYDIMNQKKQTISSYEENLQYINQFFETIPLNKLIEKHEILDKYINDVKQHQNQMKSLQEVECKLSTNLKNINDKEIQIVKQNLQALALKHDNKIKSIHEEIERLDFEYKQEQNEKSETIKLSENLDTKIQDLNKLSKQYEEFMEKQKVYYEHKYKDILELKAQLDNKVMSLVNIIESEINPKKKK